MKVEDLYAQLARTQGPKGYYFNADLSLVFDLLESLQINMKRYGYMACPCRLSSGDRGKDRDIICPCVYRAADVAGFGSCYCNLYVSKDWNEGKIKHQFVPERRPPELQF
ncbi:MAG: ferredoxin:thioredoxin reductase [Desulfobacteraceae bacterium]|nr:ferredoxin:thioredoxin reductase [Desulfobacteraceae bacterium]